MTMHFSGDRNRFALGFELIDDPDVGTELLRRSWGRLQIWVADRNLTLGHTQAGEAVDAAEVPLLPIVQWLVRAWDPLLHEERLPRPTRAVSAASWRVDVLMRLPTSSDFDAILDEREEYWQRHGLGSVLSGFRVPDLHIRRRGDRVELSWDDREWRSVPTGVQLTERPGSAVLPADEVAAVLFEFARGVLTALPNTDAEVVRLVAQLAAHRDDDCHVDRLRWLAGVDLESAARRLRAMAGVVGGSVQDTVRAILGLDAPQSPSLVTRATLPALLFRSASPRLSTDDLHVLIRMARQSGGGPDPALLALRADAPIPGSPAAITADGLERALDVRGAMGLAEDASLTGARDLETGLLPRLGITVQEVHLDDPGVDGIALAGPGITPTIAVNLTSRYARTPWGRRMTLAHELCHLLFDVGEDGRVGIVSNAWADAATERRANAFAVNFLAPEPALRTVLAPGDAEKWRAQDLERAMEHLGVGKTTLTWQLHNLGWIDAAARDYWLDV